MLYKSSKKNIVFLIIISICYLLPFFWLIRSSLMNNYEIYMMPPRIWPKKPVFGNYLEAWVEADFMRYTINTLIIAISNVIGITLSSSFAAYGFSRFNWKFRDKIFGILLLSLMFAQAATLIPQFLIWNKLGLIDTRWPLIIPSFFAPIYYTFMIRQFMLGIPKDYDEAAMIDGANHFQIFWRIILPMCKPVLVTVSLFVFLGSWNDFLGPLIYLHDENLYTLSIGLNYFKGSYGGSFHLLMAASVIATFPIIIMYFLGQKFFVQGANVGGIKG